MKKLKLQALKLGAKELLTREQLKKVLGGYGSGCCVGFDQGPNDFKVICGMDRQAAQYLCEQDMGWSICGGWACPG